MIGLSHSRRRADLGDATLWPRLLRSNLTDLSYVTYYEFTEYQDAPYVVLLGRPNATGSDVEQLIYALLNDTGTVLESMMAPGSHEIAVRHGVWIPTQTLVILSAAYEYDMYSVLAALRGRNVTVLSDYTLLEYPAPSVETAGYEAYYSVDEIDIVKQTDTTLDMAAIASSAFSITISQYNTSSTHHQLTAANGLAPGDQAIGKYWDIVVTDGCMVNEALIRIYYRHSDTDLTGDGSLGQPGDLNETSLCLYWYDPISDVWTRMGEDLDWVISIGLNTTDVTLYGEEYSGYIWPHVTHLSMFALAGRLIGGGLPLTYYALAVILSGIAVAVVTVHLFRKRKLREALEAQPSSVVSSRKP